MTIKPLRISLRQLNDLCNSPKDFAASLSSEPAKFGKTRNNFLRFAIDKVHRGLTVAEAEEYLEKQLLTFKTQTGNERYIEQFHTYLIRTNELNSKIVKVRDNITVPIKETLNPIYKVSGALARFDLLEDGYGLWFLATKTESWEEDWRLPIVTATYQKKLGVDSNELTVGVYNFESGIYSRFKFEQNKLDEAMEKLNSSLHDLLKLGVR